MASLRERFDVKYVRAPSSCWLWTASVDSSGYGKIAVGRSEFDRAHRVSWLLHRGAIPPGQCVLHTCDTPACVNPAHLFLGTRTENNADRARKGRSHSKLSANAVQEIRAAPGKHCEIAQRYNVSESLISQIKHGKVGRHV